MKRILALLLVLLTLTACSPLKPLAKQHSSGFDGELLYVNLDGETYCYRRAKAGTKGLTPEEVLDSFTAQTALEGSSGRSGPSRNTRTAPRCP